jgi:GNAT superfamily N-acetyltransferase
MHQVGGVAAGGAGKAGATPILFESATLTDPRFAALEAEALTEIALRYETDEPMLPLQADHMVEILVASVEGQAVGCAGLLVPPYMLADPDALGTGLGSVSSGIPDQMMLGEVKRLFVAPGARRLGVARALMRQLEARAVARGLAAIVLETGTAQPEALALYESLGFHQIANYGIYPDDPRSRCYAKHLR